MDISVIEPRSHPNILLRDHIYQVIQAVLALHRKHDLSYTTIDFEKVLEMAALFHDLGKLTKAFQEYINDPEHYRGNSELKQHARLSMLVFLVVAREERLSAKETLILAIVIRGHHSRLMNMPKLEMGAIETESHLLDWLNGDKRKLLQKQFDIFLAEELRNLLSQHAVMVTDLLSKLQNNLMDLHDDFLFDVIEDMLNKLDEKEALQLRLAAQYVYSMLLQADKVYLALKNPERYLQEQVRQWNPDWVELRLGKSAGGSVNTVREQVRQLMLAAMVQTSSEKVFSLTAPTGVGKTLLAATWALRTRQLVEDMDGGRSPKIIIALPFLSVIEQTADEYHRILKCGGEESDGPWLMQSHSLAKRNYSDELEDSDESFYLDNWRSEIIITTYDQLLLSLAAPKARYQTRFHNLCNAIIILDEVQSIPCRLWRPLGALLNSLAEFGNSRIMLMSATLPPFVSGAVPLLPDYKAIFKKMTRYEMHFQLSPQSLDTFAGQITDLLPGWLQQGKRVLLTMNTRNAARTLRDIIADHWLESHSDTPLYFISSDVTPKDRLETIKRIKSKNPCIVVSTQCVEAGVDLDMDEVWRDFGPLDCLIQIAGRCNREGLRARCNVHIVRLHNEKGRFFCDMIYDSIHIAETMSLVQNWHKQNRRNSIMEEEVLLLTEPYFHALADKKDTGEQWLYNYLRWQECEPIREILRGKDQEEHEFIVIKQDPELKLAMEEADRTEDRWDRLENWRKLAGRIAAITIRVRAKKGFNPQWYGEPMHNYWLLRDEYYKSETGIEIKHQDQGIIF